MGLFKRTAKIVQATVADHKQKQLDPQAELQAVYQQLIMQTSEIKRMIGEVAFAHQQLVHEAESLEQRMNDLENEAREALSRGDEDRARELLGKRRKAQEKLEDVKAREELLRRKLNHLQDAEEELRDQVLAFRDRRDDAESRLSAAAANLTLQKASEAMSHAGEQALENARDQARVAEARVEMSESIDDQLERLLRESKGS
ncbi:MAG: PspA/IM30 family protein [Bacilli bacterium]